MTRKDTIYSLENLLFNSVKFGEYYGKKKENYEISFRYEPSFADCLKLAINDLKNLDTMNEDINQLRVTAMLEGHDTEYMKIYTKGLYDALDLVLGRA